MILDINKQLDDIFKEELLQAEVIFSSGELRQH